MCDFIINKINYAIRTNVNDGVAVIVPITVAIFKANEFVLDVYCKTPENISPLPAELPVPVLLQYCIFTIQFVAFVVCKAKFIVKFNNIFNSIEIKIK